MPRRSSEKAENKQLSAFAQEFHPNEEVPAEPLDFQDFPLPSDDYVSYDYNPYLALSPEDSMYYSDRKPLRDCDRLEGLDFSTFVVFSNVKNIPLEMNIAEPGDGPARLRLCTHGYDCIRRTIDCPYTHIPNDEGTLNDSDPDARQDLVDKQSNTTPTNQSPSSLNKKLIKPSNSFSSTTSIASTISSSRSSSFSQEHYDYSLSDNSSSPPDSPTPTTRSSSIGSAHSTTSEDSLLYRSLSHSFVEDNKKMKKKEVLRAKLITRSTTSPPLTTTTTTTSRKNSEVGSNGSSSMKKKITTTTSKNLNHNGSSKKNNNTQKNYRAKKVSTSTSATTRSKTRNPTS